MWSQILEESSLVAKEMEISTEFPRVRKRKRYDDFIVNNSESIEVDDEVEYFKQNVFYVILDSVIDGLNRRFVSVYEINNRFSFLWNYLRDSEDVIHNACDNFVKFYSDYFDVKELEKELLHLKVIHRANFGDESLDPLSLLNSIVKAGLEEIFFNVCTALRIFCTLPVTVASAERSFSKRKLIKNHLRSTMTQERLNDLAVVSIESSVSKNIDFTNVIQDFANKKSRRVKFQMLILMYFKFYF